MSNSATELAEKTNADALSRGPHLPAPAIGTVEGEV